MKPLSHVTDPRMVKALAHPIRVKILAALEHRTASPSELAEQLGAPVANVSYHVRRLEALGVVKLEREARRRGAVEHYYRIETRPSIRGEAWAGAPEVVQEAFLGAVLGNISTQVNPVSRTGRRCLDSTSSRRTTTPAAIGRDECCGVALARRGEMRPRISKVPPGRRSWFDSPGSPTPTCTGNPRSCRYETAAPGAGAEHQPVGRADEQPVVLMTPEQMDKAADIAVDYREPGS